MLRLAIPLNLDDQRLSGSGHDDALYVVKRADCRAIDAADQVPALNPGVFCWTAWLHSFHPRFSRGDADNREAKREDTNGQDEVGQRASDDDGGSLADALAVEIPGGSLLVLQ